MITLKKALKRGLIALGLVSAVAGTAFCATVISQSHPEADALWQAYLDKDKKLAAEIDPDNQSAEALAKRTARDQLVRQTMLNILQLDGFKPNDAPMLFLQIKVHMDAIDAENNRWIKTRIDDLGYFTRSGDGDEAANNAFLIIQHQSDDPVFMKAMLTRFEELRQSNDVFEDDYALLFDRVAMLEGRPQRYGSQMACTNGVITLQAPLEDKTKVDVWRAEVGLPPLDEYRALVRQHSNCG